MLNNSQLFRHYIFIIVLVFTVIAIIMQAFTIMGNPFDVQAKNMDKKRINNFQSIYSEIQNFSRSNKRLPKSLSELKLSGYRESYIRDPKTNEVYEYEILSDNSYHLCAEFATNSDDEDNYYGRPVPLLDSGDTVSNSYRHKKGLDCLEFSVPASYFYITPTPYYRNYPPYPTPTLRYYPRGSISPIPTLTYIPTYVQTPFQYTTVCKGKYQSISWIRDSQTEDIDLSLSIPASAGSSGTTELITTNLTQVSSYDSGSSQRVTYQWKVPDTVSGNEIPDGSGYRIIVKTRYPNNQLSYAYSRTFTISDCSAEPQATPTKPPIVPAI